WVHVQLHQQKGMISLSPPTICNSALSRARYSETTPTKISIVPADIFESFLLTLAPVVTEHYVL
ncbi:hypothetical protein, partial [Klebsiella pneumoniae]|uniref:hypothetical protein n=1 Tax=Klebsiella pneumoniae TaxID=573 RepID=UPI00293945F1